MRIRPRQERDVPDLVGLADAVRAVDRWPPHRVGTTADFVTGGPVVTALVAEDGEGLIGHVAVHDRSADAVMELAQDALGVDRARLAVVARLFVDPRRRDRGVGRALLQAAADEVAAVGALPILDVWVELAPAVRLYERAGWRRLGTVTFSFDAPCGPGCLHAGSSLLSFVYSAPAGDPP